MVTGEGCAWCAGANLPDRGRDAERGDAAAALATALFAAWWRRSGCWTRRSRFGAEVANQPPIAVACARRMLQHSQWATLEQQLEFEWPLQGPEFAEAVAAFRDKREPSFGANP